MTKIGVIKHIVNTRGGHALELRHIWPKQVYLLSRCFSVALFSRYLFVIVIFCDLRYFAVALSFSLLANQRQSMKIAQVGTYLL